MTEEAKKIVEALRYGADGIDIIYRSALDRDAVDLIVRMSAELERTKRERDAAIRDARLGGHCAKCRFVIIDPVNEPCRSCSYGLGDDDNWQWRGVCAENSREDQHNGTF